MMSHRPLNRKSPQTASRSSEKRQKHNKHTTGNGLQTLFRLLGILHGKLPIYILNRVSAPYKQLSYTTLWLTVDEASALSLINLSTRKNCHQQLLDTAHVSWFSSTSFGATVLTQAFSSKVCSRLVETGIPRHQNNRHNFTYFYV